MDRPRKRWSFVLSLCLLLQQFSVAFAVPLEGSQSIKSKWSKNVGEDDNEDEIKEHPVAVKKSAAAGIELLKFIGNNAIKGIVITSTALTLTVTIIQAIAGCAATFPSIQKDFEEFQRLKQEYDNINNQIRDESRHAKNRQIYANDTFYNYRDTRDQLRRINDEAALVLKSMGPEVVITLNNVTQKIEQVMEDASTNNEQVDLLEVDTKFAEGLDLAMRIAFPALTLAVPGIKKLWKSHLKKTYIGKKLVEFKERFNTRLVTPKTEQARKAVSSILSKGVLGRAKNFIAKKLNKIVERFAPKFQKIKSVFGKIATGLTGLVKVSFAALSVWTLVETFNDCAKKAKDAKKSVSDMKASLQNITSYLEEVKQGNREVNEAWMEVRNTTLATDLLDTLEAIKEMMQDEFMSKAEEEKQDVVQKIQSYIDAADLDVDSEQTKDELNQRQRNMNEVLGKVSLTLSCHKNKGSTFNAVKSDCAIGDSSFRGSYETALKLIRVNPEEQCQLRTGEDYITEEKMKSAWEAWVNANQTVEALCLMNDPGKVSQIKDLLRNQKTDPREITDQVINPAKRENSYEEMEEIVQKILAENPDIANELPDDLRRYICLMKNADMDPADIAENMKIVAQSTINRELTVEEITNLECPE